MKTQVMKHVLLVLTLLSFADCKRTTVSVPTDFRTSVVSVHGINYEIAVPGGAESTVESKGFYDYRNDNLAFEEKHGGLTVNGKKIGAVKPGDTVRIDSQGAVFINDALQPRK
jgi:hypothetical protein